MSESAEGSRCEDGVHGPHHAALPTFANLSLAWYYLYLTGVVFFWMQWLSIELFPRKLEEETYVLRVTILVIRVLFWDELEFILALCPR